MPMGLQEEEVEMMELKWKESGVDVANLVLAALLFLTPWIFGFASESAAALECVGERDPDWYCGGCGAHKLCRVGGMDQPRARTVGRGLAMGPWLRHTNRANMGPRH